MKDHKDALIIHLFALLHAGCAVVCRLTGVTDDIILTLLTMLMAVIICLRQGSGERFMAAAVVLVNVLGFAIAKAISSLLGLVTAAPLVVNPISTFLTTEVLGWCTLVASEENARRSGFKPTSRGSFRWLLMAFVLILCVRLTILLLRPDRLEGGNLTASLIVDYVFSCGVLIFLAEHAIRINTRALEEQEKARLAQYRYMKLSQQVNPHFLFNSLNILDYLVCEQKTEEASTYIHKLAGIYRYLIKNEDERVVSLRDELSFVSQYVDLLKVRFQEGFEVSLDIPEQLLPCKVVPCSLQLLIENATKHNAISAGQPLRISITAGDGCLIVSNNLNPKVVSKTSSSGLGLKYLREQYLDLSGQEVIIDRSDNAYTVTIPLIK